MSNEQLEDLKQFVDAKIDGVEQRLTTRMDKTDGRLDKLGHKVDEALELLEGISGVVTDLHKGQPALIQQGNESERRIERLEHKLA